MHKGSSARMQRTSGSEPKTLMSTLTLDQTLYCVAHSEVNQRANNEDSYQVLPIQIPHPSASVTLLAIADGIGGYAHGEDISQAALQKLSISLLEQLVVLPSINDAAISPSIQEVLTTAIEQANTYILRMIDKNRWGKAGSTLVLAIVSPDRCWISNLGDSPLYHWQVSTKEFKQITTDHTVANGLRIGGLIDEEMAAHHSGKHVLELYMGCAKFPNPVPFHEVLLSAGDRLLLCSDGISGDLPQDLLQTILQSKSSLKEVSEQLMAQSLGAGATDNQTLILWEHHPELLKGATEHKIVKEPYPLNSSQTIIQGGKTMIQTGTQE